MRKLDLFNKRGSAVLDHDEVDDTAEDFYRPSALSNQTPKRVLRRVPPNEVFDDEPQQEGGFLRAQTRIRVRRGIIPESLWGKIFAAAGLITLTAGIVGGILVVRKFLLHDPRFLIENSASVRIEGNSHINRPQLLSIFGEDIGRNLFYVPLADRRAQLETLPWVEHATVMRLLPNRLRVSVVERTPVAFVRQAGRIGLVDSHGVLLDMPDTVDSSKYSFPVVTGISAGDPVSTRAARMKIFQAFITDLDSSGPKISEQLGEVDISNPSDVKALIPDHSAEILVHFGDERFLERFQRFQQQLPAWRQQYPKLASVDMRYENQAVLDMGTGAPTAAGMPATPAATVTPAPMDPPPVAKESVPAAPVASGTPGKHSAATPLLAAPMAAAAAHAVAAAKPVPPPAPAVKASSPAAKTVAQPAPALPVAKPVVATARPAASPVATKPTLQHPLMQAFDVPAKPVAKKPVAKHPAPAKPKAKAVVKSKQKPSAATAQ